MEPRKYKETKMKTNKQTNNKRKKTEQKKSKQYNRCIHGRDGVFWALSS